MNPPQTVWWKNFAMKAWGLNCQQMWSILAPRCHKLILSSRIYLRLFQHHNLKLWHSLPAWTESIFEWITTVRRDYCVSLCLVSLPFKLHHFLHTESHKKEGGNCIFASSAISEKQQCRRYVQIILTKCSPVQMSVIWKCAKVNVWLQRCQGETVKVIQTNFTSWNGVFFKCRHYMPSAAWPARKISLYFWDLS